ncbi:MAG: uroporphyrinogen decarboxylase [bacterium]|nr:uroporphyrinogen decarboxylase [bacterium]
MNDLFLRACRREPVERTPVWIMRQAGRYLPEYRAVRERVGFTTLYRTPELATEVTLQPIDRFGMDAAILFSDILVPAEAMGFDVVFNPGPVIDAPLRSSSDVRRMRVSDPEEEVPFVFEAVQQLSRELADRVPLIGFAGAPFTLAAYLIEGRGTKNFDWTKRLLFAEPQLAHDILDRVTQVTERYVAAQVRAGAQAIQLFDSWAGLLDPALYREFALRYARRVFQATRSLNVPLIYFALNSAHLHEALAGCGADVVGADWRVPLDEVSRRLGGRFALQGNLDPCVLFAEPAKIESCVRATLEQARDLPGHVFNLGHGVLPQTPVEHVAAMVEAVRRHSR